MRKTERNNVAILTPLHEELAKYSRQTGLKMTYLTDLAVFELLQRKGVKVEWPK